jgi:hypothetical protein
MGGSILPCRISDDEFPVTSMIEPREDLAGSRRALTTCDRTGIVDAVMFRIKPGKADSIEVRLVQTQGGVAGFAAVEVTHLKKAVSALSTDCLFAAYDGAMMCPRAETPPPTN